MYPDRALDFNGCFHVRVESGQDVGLLKFLIFPLTASLSP